MPDSFSTHPPWPAFDLACGTGLASQPRLSLVMPTIDWGTTCCRCLRTALGYLEDGDEALVVFDGVSPPPPAWLLANRVTLLSTGSRSGPAAARNLAAHQANGAILVFVDADVELHADTLARIRSGFSADPALSALFGSYDDHPTAPGVVSRFRNLLHHHTHSSHGGTATTFWAGCGAVRREAFLALGGFDAAAYGRPSIEDLEFGLRLSAAGGRIQLDPTIQATHHKRWTLPSMVATDIRHRAIPWSRLILARHQGSSSLNLDGRARLSSLLSLAMVLSGASLPLVPALWPAPLLALALGVLMNRRFYALCFRRGGAGLTLAAVPLHNLYFLYSLLTFLLVMMHARVMGRR